MSNKQENVVIYIGKDLSFWEEIKDQFRKSYKQSYAFKHFYYPTDLEFQSSVRTIYQLRPRVIFCDFTLEPERILHIARVLARLNYPVRPAFIGIADYNHDPRIFRLSLISGIDCVHFKNSEIDTIVFDVVALAYPKLHSHHGFAVAQLNDEANFSIMCKVSQVTPLSLQIESNLEMNPDQEYELRTYWSENGKAPRKVKNVYQSRDDLYYHYNFAQEMAYDFSGDIVELKTDGEEDKQFEDRRLHTLTEISAWIKLNRDLSVPKNIKVLAIDSDFTFFDQEKRTDQYSFMIRNQAYLKDVDQELRRHWPQIIIFNMDAPEDLSTDEENEQENGPKVSSAQSSSGDDENVKFNENNIESLTELVMGIKKIPEFFPYVLVFRSDKTSEELKEGLQYSMILAHKGDFHLEIVEKMTQIMEKKLFSKDERFDKNVVVLNKDDAKTQGQIMFKAVITSISENDFFFNSDLHLELYTILSFDWIGQTLYATITEAPSGVTASGRYYAIIHGMGELQKGALRRFVHSVFFRDKKKMQEEDLKAFEEANQRFLEEQKKKLAQELNEKSPEADDESSKDSEDE